MVIRLTVGTLHLYAIAFSLNLRYRCRFCCSTEAATGSQSDYTYMAYISQTSGADVQSIMNGKPPNQDTIDFLRSRRTGLNTKASTEPGKGIADPRWRTVSALQDSMSKSRLTLTDMERIISVKDLLSEGYEIATPVINRIIRLEASRALKAYLRHDSARLAIIEFFTSREQKVTLTEAVSIWQATVTSSVCYYPGTAPSTNGTCPRRKLAPARGGLKLHLLKCFLLRPQMEVPFSPSSKALADHLRCQWKDCTAYLASADLSDHISSHLKSQPTRCAWGHCRQRLGDRAGLKQHLAFEHCLPVLRSPAVATKYRYECAQYFHSSASWAEHCSEHLARLTLYCGQIYRRGLIITAFCCPFCLGAEYKPAAQR